MDTKPKKDKRFSNGPITSGETMSSTTYGQAKLPPLESKPWLSLREAFDRVGRERYSGNWNPAASSDPKCLPHKATRNELYTILCSMEVDACINYGRIRRLTSQDLANDCIRLDILKDGIHLEFAPGEPLPLTINAHQLEKYLRTHLKDRAKRAFTHANLVSWLKEKIQSGDANRRKVPLEKESAAIYGASRAQFSKAWKDAIAATGRSDLSRGGRAKSNR